jgi:AAA domain
MSLANVSKGLIARPYRIVLYSPEGLGKTTFASNAPNPIFLASEDGTGHVDVSRFPPPETWENCLESVRMLTNNPHEFKTFVVDTLDWIEPHVFRKVCRDSSPGKQITIEEACGGYGKGYQRALDHLRQFLSEVENLQEKRGMHVIFLAHTKIKTFKNPEGEDFDRYTMKLWDSPSCSFSGLIKEWAEEVLFANLETFSVKENKRARAKGISTGARLIYTTRTAAYDAKNRHNLPDSFPLDWNEFDKLCRKGMDPAEIEAGIREKVAGTLLEETVLAAIARAGNDATKLAQLNSWTNAKLSALPKPQTSEETTGG